MRPRRSLAFARQRFALRINGFGKWRSMRDHHLNMTPAVSHIDGHVFSVPNQGDIHDASGHFQIADVESFEASRQTRIIEINSLRQRVEPQPQARLDEAEHGC